MKLMVVLILILSSATASALPFLSVKDLLREELWHQGLKKNSQQKIDLSDTTSPLKHQLNEELQRALLKYKL